MRFTLTAYSTKYSSPCKVYKLFFDYDPYNCSFQLASNIIACKYLDCTSSVSVHGINCCIMYAVLPYGKRILGHRFPDKYPESKERREESGKMVFLFLVYSFIRLVSAS